MVSVPRHCVGPPEVIARVGDTVRLRARMVGVDLSDVGVTARLAGLGGFPEAQVVAVTIDEPTLGGFHIEIPSSQTVAGAYNIDISFYRASTNTNHGPIRVKLIING